MSALEIIQRLAKDGISLCINSDGLRAEPRANLTDEFRGLIRGGKASLLDYLAKQEALSERAAIIEFDGLLDRKSAERCAHAIVFCRDCQHYIPQPDTVSRSGFSHATPSGCELGLIAPDSWPPIYSFTGWCCPSHTKPIN